jgi:hypothetical protein
MTRDVAQTLMSAGAETLLSAGERSWPILRRAHSLPAGPRLDRVGKAQESV